MSFTAAALSRRRLHQEIENFAFIVDRAPEPEPPTCNRDHHFVEMPPRGWPWTSMAKFSGEQRPELQDPSPHRFIGDIQTALREQIFDVAIAECETDIEPNSLPDDRRRELVAANEIVIRHLTCRTATRYRSPDKAVG